MFASATRDGRVRGSRRASDRRVAIGELGTRHAPVGCDLRIVPRHAELVGRVVVAVYQVCDRHVGERCEAVRHAGRDEHAGVGVLAALGLTQIEHLGRAVGRAAGAEIVQHDTRPAERHVPVVGLVQVVVQSDDATRGTVGSVRLDHLAAARYPLAPVCLDEQPALVAVNRGDDVEDAGDELALGDGRHRYSRSARE